MESRLALHCQLEPPDLAARKGLTQPSGDPNAPAIKEGGKP